MKEKIDIEFNGVTEERCIYFLNGIVNLYEQGRCVTPDGRGGVKISITPEILNDLLRTIETAFNGCALNLAKEALNKGARAGAEQYAKMIAENKPMPQAKPPTAASESQPVAPDKGAEGSTAIIQRDSEGRITGIVQKYIYDEKQANDAFVIAKALRK